MPKQKINQQLTRTVRVSFEPTRLPQDCQAQAYATLVPILRRRPAIQQLGQHSEAQDSLPNCGQQGGGR